ncbi:Histone-lysine N-methyltransferase [Pyrenophora tritici-repentis]|uniref:Histone-lysine N-methyltransferase, H3 lysine-36 specific n=1 Tax=Pyrenophora tritici-repentis (strain Pt-1C-BFP) TaxID=426418 RepID=B2W0G7_PYRTR|nr:histone-lysine N-methyltransferase [Pyrenophora tritici-repentis Pt-1C-BFP]EDU46790.1 histone-lysine N-methyltransferase [Pyrenophora tritici-repentis Pt-1C-BFP]KAI1670197.1 Histone-lysine N-methyltransferase [Pyrenophora tritici-repentis]KAI1681804.1 Histone-lysine N-methyltransferase [Pyrenophora tritici-repentis]
MSDTESEQHTARLEPELREMKLGAAHSEGAGEGDGASEVKVEDEAFLDRVPASLAIPPRLKSRSKSQSPRVKHDSEAPSPGSAHEETLAGDITLKMEPGKPPKLSRTASQKVVTRSPPLYLDLPDSTEAAKETFVVLPECTYANKTIGTTDPALECDCQEEYDSATKTNHACDEDSDCINRATKMECVGDCSCGRTCQNQRFQRKQYADVTVIKTEKKGFGLRANKNMVPGDFVFEYIGEVIDERTFRRRMGQYDEEGIKHFYFMSLTKGEFVDATKKGNLGRFCNHSCNPNCFVDKWVVGDKLRMGIFVERNVRAGEELVFNYNVDRYGADPQPCYCGEPNCSGFIGGKTQSDNATKLSGATIEALGIDDGAGWDTAVAKKPRKKKASEDDEEYVNDLQPRELEEDGVKKVMPALRNCTEKWIAVKLLSRMQTNNERVGHRIVQFHGYNILKTTLTTWKEDTNVVLQVLDILHRLPRITRNKIQDSKIEEAVQELTHYGDERVRESAEKLLKEWSKLEVAYRIPRMKRDPNAGTAARTENHFERRERGRERSRSRSKSPSTIAPKGPSAASAPSGPRVLNAPRGPAGFFVPPRPVMRPRPFNTLPAGWFQASAENGSTYFYNSAGTTQWQRPTQPANTPPPPPNKARDNTQLLKDIISNITSNPTASGPSTSTTPQPVADEQKEKPSGRDKWRTLTIEKQEKVYEATIAPYIMSTANLYSKKLEKEEFKSLCKEVAKKVVRGDYKNGPVKDPTAKIPLNHQKRIKNCVHEYMNKAVKTAEERRKMKASRSSSSRATSKDATTPNTPQYPPKDHDHSHQNSGSSTPKATNTTFSTDSSHDLKRKRSSDNTTDASSTSASTTHSTSSPKRTRTASETLPSAPPPPPPPPPPETTDTEEASLTPMYDSPGTMSKAVAFQQPDGYGSPMQLATPPTNGNIHSGGGGGGSRA